jgi:hypothetical protein
MPPSTANTQYPRKRGLALRRETQIAIGQQPRVECELLQEMPPELPPLIRRDKEHDPYADIAGTC